MERKRLSAPVPAVVSVGKEINEPRYPAYMGIHKANKAKIPTVTLGELGVDGSSARTAWTNIRKPTKHETIWSSLTVRQAQERRPEAGRHIAGEG